MKKLLLGAAALVTAMGTIGATAANADPRDHHGGYHDNRGWDHNRGYDGRRYDGWRGDRGFRHEPWRRGQYIPRAYYNRYEVVDYRYHHLRAPPYGYRYVRDDRGDILLTALATGLIVGVIASH